jgi:hypothetical protein
MRHLLFALAIVQCFNVGVSPGANADSLDVIVAQAKFNARPLRFFVYDLVGLAGVHISLEVRTFGSGPSLGDLPVTMDLSNVSLRQILQAIDPAHQRLAWTADRDVVNIFERGMDRDPNWPLNDRLQQFDKTAYPFDFVNALADFDSRIEHSQVVLTEGDILSLDEVAKTATLKPMDVHLSLRDRTIRQSLNDFCIASHDTHGELISWYAIGQPADPDAKIPAKAIIDLQVVRDGIATPRYLSLDQFLEEYGQKLSLYFTIERDLRTKRPAPARSLANVRIADPGPQNIVDANHLMTILRQKCPDAVVVRSSGDPNLIHVLDGTIPDSGDVLDQPLTIKFKGTLASFLGRLQDFSGGNLQYPDGLQPLKSDDGKLNVDVDATGSTYREVISASIPRDGYHHVLWTAIRYPAFGSVPDSTDIRLTGRLPDTRPSVTTRPG